MKLHKTATHSISEPNHTLVELKVVPTNDHTESKPLYDDIDVRPGTMGRAKDRGLGENFVHMIKKISSLALEGFKPGDRVDSTMLCADIRYGLWNDKLAGDADVPGLDKPERLDAGRVIWLLADAGELPLEPLGRDGANLQQYRVK